MIALTVENVLKIKNEEIAIHGERIQRPGKHFGGAINRQLTRKARK